MRLKLLRVTVFGRYRRARAMHSVRKGFAQVTGVHGAFYRDLADPVAKTIGDSTGQQAAATEAEGGGGNELRSRQGTRLVPKGAATICGASAR